MAKGQETTEPTISKQETTMSDIDIKSDRKYMCMETFGDISSLKSGEAITYYSGNVVPSNVKSAIRVAYHDGLGVPVARKIAFGEYNFIFQRS